MVQVNIMIEKTVSLTVGKYIGRTIQNDLAHTMYMLLLRRILSLISMHFPNMFSKVSH